MQRTYLSIDLKSFYASAECVARNLDPLTAKLVVADASRTDKTICLAVSPALKAYGISGRSRLFEVNQKLDEIFKLTGEKIEYIIAEPRMRFYMQKASEIYEIYLKYVSPEDIHVYSIDEVFIDASPYLFSYKTDARSFASMLMKEIFLKTGITATAGIGTNLYLAKVAMDIYAKKAVPDEYGMRIGELDEENYKKYMWNHRPLTDFWQIGSKTAKKLEENLMHTMGDIARMSIKNEEHLYRLFGIDAELLIDHAWGIEPTLIKDIKSYTPSANSISSSQVLPTPYTVEKARIVVFEMADALSLELIMGEFAAESITLDIGFDRENIDKGEYKGKTHIDRYGRKVPEHIHGTFRFANATNSCKEITAAVLSIYDKKVNTSLTIRRLSLSANNILPESSVIRQIDIFTDPESAKKERKLRKAELSIKNKYGKNLIMKAASLTEGATAAERNEKLGGHKA